MLKLKGAVHNHTVEVFSQWEYGVLRKQGRLCVPHVGDLIQYILVETHNSKYTINLGDTKMYHDLQEVY